MSDKKELRGDAPLELVRVLDALALSNNLSRHAYMLEVLEKHCAAEVIKHNLLSSMLRGNPEPVVSDRMRGGCLQNALAPCVRVAA